MPAMEANWAHRHLWKCTAYAKIPADKEAGQTCDLPPQFEQSFQGDLFSLVVGEPRCLAENPSCSLSECLLQSEGAKEFCSQVMPTLKRPGVG